MAELIIQYWVQWLCGIVSASALGIAGYWWKKGKARIEAERAKIKAEADEQKLLKDGLLAILHDRLYQMCTHFLKSGEINASALKNIEHIYNSYRALGGNGTGKMLYEACQKLPQTMDSTYER